MFDKHHNLFFIVIVLSIIAFSAYLFFASKIVSDASGNGSYVEVHDDYEHGVHNLSGSVIMPSSCIDVYVDAEVKIDTMVISIVPLPKKNRSGACILGETRVPFNINLAAPPISYYLAEISGTIHSVNIIK